MKREKKVGDITEILPLGNTVLVEMLRPQEAACTALHLPENSKQVAPQGIILGFGPMVEAEKWGFHVGDRVVLQGSFVPVPRLQEGGRDLGIVDPHAIKAALVEGAKILV